MALQDTDIWREMLSGNPYNAIDPQLLAALSHMRDRVAEFNAYVPTDTEMQLEWLRKYLGSIGENVTINQPFRCDYGANIYIGDNTVINFNMTILDEGEVRIGSNVYIGPNCSIYTPCHPLDPEERNQGIEWSLPVTIGDNCWLGGNVVICPGVTIGEGCTIGAGSVVVSDIPTRSVAVGNPCKVIKKI
ncbi:MAG: sugar O-acetyltransferase [Bacteroidales bacterium]|nr:sugar O-acetyltransferase [Bacteroidales bacterium]